MRAPVSISITVHTLVMNLKLRPRDCEREGIGRGPAGGPFTAWITRGSVERRTFLYYVGRSLNRSKGLTLASETDMRENDSIECSLEVYRVRQFRLPKTGGRACTVTVSRGLSGSIKSEIQYIT